jgi:hypothetical protein
MSPLFITPLLSLTLHPGPLPFTPTRTSAVLSSALTDASAASSRKNWISHWLDHLKFGGAEPTFDVLQRTMEYASTKTNEEAVPYYAADYVFRGSIIGPITNQDVIDTQGGFDITGAYPDLDRGVFGFTLDPNNAFRCFFFERWTATHTGTINIGPFIKLPATNKRVETPLHITSITWNPEGKIVYQSISPPVDRFEGNTKGGGAIFGLLTGAGVDGGPASVGLPTLMLQQKLVQASGLVGKQWSDEDRIPRWWKSAARGADPNDM